MPVLLSNSTPSQKLATGKQKVGPLAITVAVLALLLIVGFLFKQSFGGGPAINAQRQKEADDWIAAMKRTPAPATSTAPGSK